MKNKILIILTQIIFVSSLFADVYFTSYDKSVTPNPDWVWEIKDENFKSIYIRLDDNEWEMISKNKVSYTPKNNLSVGKHTLYLKLLNEDGSESEVVSQTITISPLQYELSLVPKDDGSYQTGYINYRYNNSFSISIEGFMEYTAKDEQLLDDQEESRNVTKEENYDFNLRFLNWHQSTDDFDITIGGGMNVTYLTVSELGFFFFPDDTTKQLFSNETQTLFLGPIAVAEFEKKFEVVDVEYKLSYIPFYNYNFIQDLLIAPLTESSGTQNYWETGSMYLENIIGVTLFDWVKFTLQHEYQQINFNQLNLSYDEVNSSFGYEAIPLSMEMHTIGTFISYTNSDGSFKAGPGYRFSILYDTVNDETTFTHQPAIMFSVAQ